MSDLLKDFMSSDLRTGETKTNEQLQRDFIKKIKELNYNTNELAPIIENKERFQIIEAIAGAGKTTALNFKLINDIQSGYMFQNTAWVNTFLKTGAQDLVRTTVEKAKQLKTPINLSNVNFSTLHSEFYQVLTQIGLNINIIDYKTEDKIYQTTAKEFKLGVNGHYLNNEELSLFKLLVSRFRNNLGVLEKDVYENDKVKELNITEENLKYLVKNMYNIRRRFKVYDFEDLQDLLYEYTVKQPNPAIVNILQNKYQFIYLDEFQDVSRIQYEILKVYFAKVKQVVVVGDSDQSIYSWRGSDIKIITDDFINDFQPSIMHLSTSYRVPKNILEPISRSIAQNKERIPKEIVSYKEGGELDIYTFKNKQDMLNYIVRSLYKDQMEGKSVAVLASTNAALTELGVLLNLQRKNIVYFKIRGNLVNLDAAKFAKYWHLAYLFTTKHSYYLRQNIETISKEYRGGFKSKNLAEAIQNNGLNLVDLVQYIREPEVFGDDKLAYAVAALKGASKDLIDWLEYMYTLKGETPKQKLLQTFIYLRENEKKKKSNFKDGNIAILNLFISMLKFDNQIETVPNFLSEINRQSNLLKTAYNIEDAPIVLTTAFEFKGKEADVVYILEDTLYNFPRSKSEASKIEEERRLHYIAGTRATQKMIYTTIDGFWSPFLKEMHVQPVRPLLPILEEDKNVLNNRGKMTEEDIIKDLEISLGTEFK